MDNIRTLTPVQPHQQFSDEQLNLIRSVVARGTTPEQFRFFIEVCNHYRLNPIARQIYAVVRQGQLTIQTSIDGFRLMAERTGRYAGQIGPQWCGEDGVWCDVWLKREPPAAARVGIVRRDFDQPIWGIARYVSYVQPGSPVWSKMPDVMLAKCAESLGFRRTFPAEMSGIYTHEEMSQADHSQVQRGPLPEVMVTPVEDIEELQQPYTEEEAQPPVQIELSMHQLIGRAKKRAHSMGLANTAEEWAGMLEFLGLEEIAELPDILLVNEYLDSCLQQQEQPQEQAQ